MPLNNSGNQLEHSVADQQRAQKVFIERGLASLRAAQKSGEYVSSEDVLRALDEIIASVKKKAQK